MQIESALSQIFTKNVLKLSWGTAVGGASR